MSYILDALKKAEHERVIGQVPGIGSEHEPATRSGPGRWIWLLLSVLLVNAVLLAVLLWPDASSTPTVDAVATVTDKPVQGCGSRVQRCHCGQQLRQRRRNKQLSHRMSRH